MGVKCQTIGGKRRYIAWLKKKGYAPRHIKKAMGIGEREYRKLLRNSKKSSYHHASFKTPDYHKRYYQRNKVKINATRKAKRNNDINFKLRGYLRSRIWHVLKGNQQSDRTMQLIGCSLIELIHYLESKFQDDMTWKNYGLKGWHVDHIRPCASFDLSDSEEQRKCFHYTNLQPLWAKENLQKADKYPLISEQC